MNNEQKIIDFIIDELLEDEDEEITPQSSLFKDRILDSLNLLSLISFLENTYDVKIATSEVNFENLDTVANMEAFLGKKLK